MSRTEFDPKAQPADPREMPQPKQHYPELMCRVDGCPNRWSVHREGWKPMCSAHAWSDPHRWPEITAEQQAWVEQHRLYGEARAAARSVTNTPAPKREPQPPQSSSRAWRALHGVEDVEADREAP